MRIRPAGCVDGCVRAADRLRQRPRGSAGAGAGSLLHIQRSDCPRGSTHQQLQVQRRRHPADVTVASRGVALRKQSGNVTFVTVPEEGEHILPADKR